MRLVCPLPLLLLRQPFPPSPLRKAAGRSQSPVSLQIPLATRPLPPHKALVPAGQREELIRTLFPQPLLLSSISFQLPGLPFPIPLSLSSLEDIPQVPAREYPDWAASSGVAGREVPTRIHAASVVPAWSSPILVAISPRLVSGVGTATVSSTGLCPTRVTGLSVWQSWL